MSAATVTMDRMRLIVHAIFGGAIGIFTSVIFLLLYYGTQYSLPVSDAIRFKSAFWNTMFIVCVIFAVLFYRDIRDNLHLMFGETDTVDTIEDDDETE